MSATMPFGFQCGDGWFGILWRLCVDLEPMVMELEKETGERFQVLQVKEKLGTLRFYVTHHTAAIDGRIAEAQLESSRTCEIRGKPGQPRSGRWIQTLSDELAGHEGGHGQALQMRGVHGEGSHEEAGRRGLGFRRFSRMIPSRSLRRAGASHSLRLAGPRGHTNEVTYMDCDGGSCTGGARSRQHQETPGTGGSRKDDGVGMSHLREGAWIDAKTGQCPFIDEHADRGKCPGSLASIG